MRWRTLWESKVHDVSRFETLWLYLGSLQGLEMVEPIFRNEVGSYFVHQNRMEVKRVFLEKKKQIILVLVIPVILLMEKILHHQECIKSCKYWENLPINWCRTSSSNSINQFLDASEGETSVAKEIFCWSLAPRFVSPSLWPHWC